MNLSKPLRYVSANEYQIAELLIDICEPLLGLEAYRLIHDITSDVHAGYNTLGKKSKSKESPLVQRPFKVAGGTMLV